MITAETIVDVCNEPQHKMRFENELVRAYWIDLPPGAATQFHRHEYPCAGICVGDSVIRNEVLGGSSIECAMRDGDVLYSPGKMTHRIENAGETWFRNFTVEVLRGAGHTSSSVKRLERERREVRVIVDERAVCVATMELSPGERCDLIGDHLVVWLQGDVMTSTFLDRKALGKAGDFAWCCGVATVESVGGAKVAIMEVV